MDVETITAANVPVEIGFTAEGWFSVRIPLLLPKKERGSAEYVRSILLPALKTFFAGRPPVRFDNCVLIYRHVYAEDRPERQRRDHDNIEINMVSDCIALYVMTDDAPGLCSLQRLRDSRAHRGLRRATARVCRMARGRESHAGRGGEVI